MTPEPAAPKPIKRIRSIRKIRFEYWRRHGQWYWHVKGLNGRIVANGEGYHNEEDCLNVYRILCQMTLGNSELRNTDKKKPRNYEGKLNRNWP